MYMYYKTCTCTTTGKLREQPYWWCNGWRARLKCGKSWVRAWLDGITIMCPSEATCLSLDCCLSELAL